MSTLSSLPVEKQLARQPVPTQYEVTLVQAAEGGSNFVVLELRTNSGEQTFFFDPESAEVFGLQIVQAAARARGGGLIVAGPEDLEVLNGEGPE